MSMSETHVRNSSPRHQTLFSEPMECLRDQCLLDMQSQLGWAAQCFSVIELSFVVPSFEFHFVELCCQNLCTLPATGVQCVSISESLISLVDPLKTKWWLFWIKFLNQSNVLKTLSPKMLQVWALLPKSSIVPPDHVRKFWGSLVCVWGCVFGLYTLCAYIWQLCLAVSYQGQVWLRSKRQHVLHAFRCTLNVPRTQRLFISRLYHLFHPLFEQQEAVSYIFPSLSH